MTLAITVREAKAALAQIKKLTPAHPRLDDDTRLSLKEAVFLMAPELVAMTKRGFTLKELSDGLQAQSIPIKPATLNRYFNEYKAGQTESETVPETSPETMKEPSAGSAEAGTAPKSYEDGASPLSRKKREKSESTSPALRMLFRDGQEENPPKPPEGNQGECQM
jgi:hypothetical protein